MNKIPLPKDIRSQMGRLTLRKIARYVFSIIGIAMFIFVLLFLFFPDPFINTIFRDRISKYLIETYPAYSIKLGDMHFDLLENNLKCDSIILESIDSSFSCSAYPLSISGIRWIKIFLQRDFTLDVFTNTFIDAENITTNLYKEQNELLFENLHISLPDSEMTISSIKYRPAIDDEQFFAKSPFRQTRMRINIPHMKIIGLDYISLIRGNLFAAKSITLKNIFADILVNMDMPSNNSLPNPRMPNEFFSSRKEEVEIDSLIIINGRLKYSERYIINKLPGVITFDSVKIFVSGIANHTIQPDTTYIMGTGLFMNSGLIKVSMAIPLTSKDFSLQYLGSLSKMDLTEINSFTEPGEHKRIKSGSMHSAAFNILVNSGYANGNLRAEYSDLSIALLDKDTGSENGIFNQISTLISKTFVIRKNNIPGEKDSMKIGEIKYTRNPDDTFLQFLWFALRSGIGDVIGF